MHFKVCLGRKFLVEQMNQSLHYFRNPSKAGTIQLYNNTQCNVTQPKFMSPPPYPLFISFS